MHSMCAGLKYEFLNPAWFEVEYSGIIVVVSLALFTVILIEVGYSRQYL